MSGYPFQIPGLGQAQPNQRLPIPNLPPDLLAAAAALGAVDELALGGANGTQSQGQNQQNQAKELNPVEVKEEIKDENMEVDNDREVKQENSNPPQKDDTEMLDHGAGQDAPTTQVSAEGKPTEDVKMEQTGDAAPSPGVTDALEAALERMIATTAGQAQSTEAQPAQQQENGNGGEAEHPEWEVDSSPYESSSESSSSDSSDDDSEDEGGYPLLGIEETARMLMAADADVDGMNRTGKGAAASVRTKNEMPEEILPKPDVIITPEMKIEPLGVVEFIVENTVVIKSKTPGETQVLNMGSVLCREDRTVIGQLAEIIGNVRTPMYTVGFASPEDIIELGLSVGTEVFYSVEHAQYVFTEALREVKGSDASNLHDEEVAPDEMEFSDDEKEIEYRRQLKAKRRAGKGGRGGREQNSQPHPLSKAESATGNPNNNLNYDEDDDGPYKPLARPPGFGQGTPSSLPSLPPKPETGFSPPRGGHNHGHGHRGSHRGGRGDFRGRGNRDRGGGYRGGDRQHGGYRGGRGGSRPPFGGYDGASSPPKPYSHPQPPLPQNAHFPPPPYGAKPPGPPAPVPTPGQWPAVPPAGLYPPPPVPYARPQSQPHVSPPPPPPQSHLPPTSSFNFNYQAYHQNQGQQYQYPQPPHHQVAQQHQPAHTHYPQAPVPPPAWPGVAGQPPPPAGAYVNPTFFGGLQQHAQQAHTQPPQPQQPVQHQQPQQQQYWGQQYGAYGQGPK
ncbi:Gar1/Naf1 RNA binding region-domain-containing protein [Diplogelasinospora grovesii]|uniref:H/ACA ribonucleoprotein complex non-core subunit NAF1 n=1 Tax=Diplogelasinospora grovesii TaxID=303347 RepID=A0AAN6N7B1_9PEZI|nr:Gar1/Naf1 RNA binding region-domain-containing protein [Diplogelasinospora grovesii]